MRQETLELHPDKQPMLDCPKYLRCSAPLCPLDPKLPPRVPPRVLVAGLVAVPHRDGRIDGSKTGGVREPECRLPKADRLELGKALPWRGLWPAELAALRRWERATPEERKTQGEAMNGNWECSPECP